MGEFADKIYALCKKVPNGKVTTYKAIGDAVGIRGYRAVGGALHKNPYAPTVPCHSVVASDGSIGGFASGVRKKIALLKKECILVKNGKVVDFDSVRLKKM